MTFILVDNFVKQAHESILKLTLSKLKHQLDGCIVWNAHNTVLGGEALLIYIVPVCYVKTGKCEKT